DVQFAQLVSTGFVRRNHTISIYIIYVNLSIGFCHIRDCRVRTLEPSSRSAPTQTEKPVLPGNATSCELLERTALQHDCLGPEHRCVRLRQRNCVEQRPVSGDT